MSKWLNSEPLFHSKQQQLYTLWLTNYSVLYFGVAVSEIQAKAVLHTTEVYGREYV